MRSLILLCLVGLAVATDPFMEFVKLHKKEYKSGAELALRRSIFEANYADITAHNKRYDEGEVTWWRKVTPYSDLTQEEFAAAFSSGLPAYDVDTVMEDHIDQAYADMLEERRFEAAPDEWNWVQQGGVSSVKNQGQCGSCADFAVVAIIESCFWLQRGVMFDDLSEQHLMDCAYNHYYNDNEGSWGAFGCDGAWPVAYMDWVVNYNSGKIQTESSYPYEAVTRSCRQSSSGNFNGGTVTGMYNKWNTNEADMKELVYLNPVTTSILASYLGDYGGGIYNDPRCCEQISDPQCKWNLNHEVTVVGYGRESGTDYWLIKNSWDTWFGENGYFKIIRGRGHCGVGSLHYTSAYCSAS